MHIWHCPQCQSPLSSLIQLALWASWNKMALSAQLWYYCPVSMELTMAIVYLQNWWSSVNYLMIICYSSGNKQKQTNIAYHLVIICYLTTNKQKSLSSDDHFMIICWVSENKQRNKHLMITYLLSDNKEKSFSSGDHLWIIW